MSKAMAALTSTPEGEAGADGKDWAKAGADGEGEAGGRDEEGEDFLSALHEAFESANARADEASTRAERLQAEVDALERNAAGAAAASEASATRARETIDRLTAESHALRVETAAADADLAAGAAAVELRSQRAQLEAAQEKMASMERMLNAQLAAGDAAHEAEVRLRAEVSSALAERHEAAERKQQSAYREAMERAEAAEGDAAGGEVSGGGGAGGSVVVGAEKEARRDSMTRLEDEVAALRTALGGSHATSARLQEELRASEGELTELSDGYTLVWEELQQQRAAMAAARAQCDALQEQVDRAAVERTPRSARSVR